MSYQPPQISDAERSAFSAVLRSARENRGWSYNDAAEAASVELGGVVLWGYVQALEFKPTNPIATCPKKLFALLRAYDLGWPDVLSALGVWDPEDPAAEVFKL